MLEPHLDRDDVAKHDETLGRDPASRLAEPHERTVGSVALVTRLAIIIGPLVIAGSVLSSANRSADLWATNARANGSVTALNPSQSAPQQPTQYL